MSTKIKKMICIFLALIFVFSLAGCNESATDEDYETIYPCDPREEAGYVKDGFAYLQSYAEGTMFTPSGAEQALAYKIPDVIEPEKETVPIELFYGHIYSPYTNPKTYQHLSIDLYSIGHMSEDGTFHALEENIPTDDFKNYYVTESRTQTSYRENYVSTHYYLNFGHSKTYSLPTSVFKEGASSISLVLRAHRRSKIFTPCEMKIYYSVDNGAIKIYTSREYSDLTAGKDINNKNIKDLREEFTPLTVDPALANKLDYYKGPVLREEGKLMIGFTDIYHHDTEKEPENDFQYLVACKIPEEISADDTTLSIDLYYGYYGNEVTEFTEYVRSPLYVMAYASDKTKITLDDGISPEEFGTYKVVPHNTDYKYKDNIIGETVIYESLYVFDHNETYEIDSSWLSGDKGYFTICVTVPHLNETKLPSGITELGFADSVTVFYIKQDGKIKFYTYSEYSKLVESR